MLKTKHGSLEVICGPMFSGKSEELIRRLKRARIAKLKTAVFKHAIDDRYDLDHVVSHNGNKLDAHATDNGAFLLSKLDNKQYAVVGIDEIQFYSNDIIPVIVSLVDKGTRVIVAGLDMDYRGAPFGPMPTLLALADSVTKLKAICTECGADAHFSQLIEQKPTPTETSAFVLVAAADKFTARCRSCHSIDKPFNYREYLESLRHG